MAKHPCVLNDVRVVACHVNSTAAAATDAMTMADRGLKQI